MVRILKIMKRRESNLLVEESSKESVVIKESESLLKQLFVNLIDNAIKCTAKKDTITLSDELSGFKELVFTDFYLVSNKQDEANTIYTTNRFSSQGK